MTTEGKTLLASCLLHLAAVGTAVSFGAISHKPQVPIVVDFTMEQGPSAEQRSTHGDSGAPPSSVPQFRSPLPKAAPVAMTTPVERAVTAKPVDVSTAQTVTHAAIPIAAASPTGGVAGGHPRSTGGVSQGVSSGSGEKSSGTANRAHGESAESRQTQYLKEHFDYIRNTIAGNLRYPARARKMGWNGKLAVEFVILESGTVDKIRITKSSGVPMLDSDAEETIRRSAPFPKPPVSARLVIPVEYVLK